MIGGTGNTAPVRDFRGLAYLRKWRETIGFARAQQTDVPSKHARGAAVRPLDAPIFILGSPRSGTTYLGSLLAALPSSSYFYEPPIFKYRSRHIYQGSVPQWRVRLIYEFGLRLLLLAAPGSGPRIVEKNPNHTWVAEQIAAAFPKAKFVMIVRDGRDVAASLAEKPWHRRDQGGQNRREPGGYMTGTAPHFYIETDRHDEYTGTSDVHRCAWIWRRHTEELIRLRSALPVGTWHELRYEDLVVTPQETIGELLSFLGEASAEATAAATSAAGAGHAKSVGRWRDSFDAGEVAEVQAECGETLHQLGYD